MFLQVVLSWTRPHCVRGRLQSEENCRLYYTNFLDVTWPFGKLFHGLFGRCYLRQWFMEKFMNVEMLACIARLNLCNDVIVIRGGIFEEPTYMPIISRIIECTWKDLSRNFWKELIHLFVMCSHCRRVCFGKTSRKDDWFRTCLVLVAKQKF